MSSYIEINRLLDEIGTSSRSASDPWTLGRSSNSITRDSRNPAILADLASSPDELAREIQAQLETREANRLTSKQGQSQQSSTSPSGPGILQGLLNIFPLASGIMKLFGLGDASSPQVLNTYLHPAAIAFEGALTGSMSNVTSLTYGADGLPRVVRGTEQPAFAGPEATGTASADSLLREVSGSSWSRDTVHDLQALVEKGVDAVSNASSARPQSSADSIGEGLAMGHEIQWPGFLAELGTLAHSGFFPGVSTTSLNPLFDSANTAYAQGNETAPAVDPTGAAGSGYGAWPSLGKDDTEESHRATGQNILVQVHAMDSQSFMDHSQEIAQAVRQAMLNMHSVNDVMSDL